MRKYSDGATLCEVLDYKERRKSDYCIREVEGSKREMMMTRHNSLERSHDVSRRQMTGAGAGLGPLQLMYRDNRDNRDCQRPKTGEETGWSGLSNCVFRWAVSAVSGAVSVLVTGRGISASPRDGGQDCSPTPVRIT